MKTLPLVATVALCAGSSALSQGTFQNLDFEGALPPIVPTTNEVGAVPVALALPGWTVYYAGIPQERIGYNAFIGGDVRVILVANIFFPPILGGDYRVALSAALYDPQAPPESVRVAIGQTGQIPSWAQSIRLKTSYGFDPTLLNARFGGADVPLQQVGAGPGYLVAGGDISAYAGQTGELQLTGVPRYFVPVASYVDDIEFSPEPVPEPSSLFLLVLGIATLSWRMLKRR